MAGEDRQTWIKIGATLAIIALDAVWIVLSDFTFDFAATAKVAGIVAFLFALGLFYRFRRPMKNFEVMCVETAILLGFSAAAAVFSYLLTSLNYPLVDDVLVRADKAFGFDWLAYVGFVSERPWLAKLSKLIYATNITQMALVVVVLGLTGRLVRSRQLVSAVILSGTACVVLAGFVPSAGAVAHFSPPDSFFASGQPIVSVAYMQEFYDIRSGVSRLISLDRVQGLVSFPSYHGTMAVLIIICLWPLKYWRWPALAFNVAVLFATPVDGGHHLTDILGGVAIAFIAWHLAGRFAARLTQPSAQAALPATATA